jgi:Ulp1 family protease
VWEELCKFRIKEAVGKGHVKVGIVFNLDIHTGPGTHWVAVFLDLNKKIMYYFDSAGDSIKEEPHIYTLFTKLKHQDSAMVLRENHPIEHQYGDSECGMYAMFFVVTMLQTNNFKLFTNKNKVFKDHLMTKLRSKLYNKNRSKKKKNARRFTKKRHPQP